MSKNNNKDTDKDTNKQPTEQSNTAQSTQSTQDPMDKMVDVKGLRYGNFWYGPERYGIERGVNTAVPKGLLNSLMRLPGGQDPYVELA